MIAYTDPKTNNVHICSLLTTVPKGVKGYKVDAPDDREFRDAWQLVDGKIVINEKKKKQILKSRNGGWLKRFFNKIKM